MEISVYDRGIHRSDERRHILRPVRTAGLRHILIVKARKAFSVRLPHIRTGIIPDLNDPGSGFSADDIIETAVIFGLSVITGNIVRGKLRIPAVKKKFPDPFLSQVHVRADDHSFPTPQKLRSDLLKIGVPGRKLDLCLKFNSHPKGSVDPRHALRFCPDFFKTDLIIAELRVPLSPCLLLRLDPDPPEVRIIELLLQGKKNIGRFSDFPENQRIEHIERDHVIRLQPVRHSFRRHFSGQLRFRAHDNFSSLVRTQYGICPECFIFQNIILKIQRTEIGERRDFGVTAPVFLIAFPDARHPVHQSVMKLSVKISAGHRYLILSLLQSNISLVSAFTLIGQRVLF